METVTKSDVGEILTRLARLQSDMNSIKEHLEDITLSEDEIEELEAYGEEKKNGKLISHEELKEELEL